MARPLLPLASGLSRRHILCSGAALILAGCGLRDDIEAHGQAFTEPQIPPGLPPEHYPPHGFVWSGLKVAKMPEARYGVAAPPVNPRGHFLILADAPYPAEVYFDIARLLSSLGFSVWIFEAPGQGGSGRYFLENQHTDIENFRHSARCAHRLISDIIRPDPHNPLYVFGHGSGALTAMQLEGLSIQQLWLYDIWGGPHTAESAVWSGDIIPEDDWGRIAHRWQRANPDLRLKGVSKRWLTERDKARKAALGARPAFPVHWLEPSASMARGQSLCERLKSCQILTVEDRNALKSCLASHPWA